MAIGLHLAIFLLAFYMPSLLERSYERPEFYTVNLVSMGELGGPAAPAPTAKEVTPDKGKTETKAEPPQLPPSPAKEEVKVEKPLPEPPPPPEPKPEPKPVPKEEPKVVPLPEKMAIPEPKPVAKEVVSLEPSKAIAKVKEQKKEAVQKVKEETKLTKALTRIQANVQEKEAKAEANKANKEALNALRQTIRMGDQTGRPATTSGEPKSGSGGPSGGGGPVLDLAYKSYLALIHQRIQEHWILPDLPNWKEQLESIVVIQIRKDGELEKNFFEKTSGNKQFDQYVMKAVNESLPMPPFPPEIKESSLEIGLRFQPGKLF